MALRLLTSFCLLAPLSIQLACTACGGSTRPPVREQPAVVAQEEAPLKLATCDDCGSDAFCNSLGACTPNAWHCGPMYYGGGAADGCDCDCGVPDPDCDVAGVDHWCYGAGKPYKVDACSACGAPAS